MSDDSRPIIVTSHAVQAYQRRLNDKRSYPVLEREIRECVELALKKGMVYSRRPEGFLLYGRKKDARILPPGQSFVRCDKQSNFGFILKHTDDEGDIVLTTITRVGVR